MDQPTESASRVIKRYPNRKLYDTQKSCYVTLDEIAAMVKEGQDIRIIDNKTNEDITGVTLTQIIFEEEKKNKSILPLSALKKIIQSGQEFLQTRITEGAERMTHLREGTEKQMQRLVNRGEMTAEEMRRMLGEFFQTRQRNVEEFQKNLDERIRHYMERMFGKEYPAEAGSPRPASDPAHAPEIQRLRQRVEELERKLKDLTDEE